MSRLTSKAAFLFVLLFIAWAVSSVDGAARVRLPEPAGTLQTFGLFFDNLQGGERRARSADARGRALPYSVSFEEDEGRGLLVRTWVNGVGPYTFAVDTGAGATIISSRIAREARVAVNGGQVVDISGLSGSSAAAGRRASVSSLAIGGRENLLPAKGMVIVADGLPSDLGGVLDPTEAFSPLGYVIDMPRRQLSAFDPRSTPLRLGDEPPGGTVVRWLAEGGGRRPFVPLAGGGRALIDTGSGFGLALNENAAKTLGASRLEGREHYGTRDIAGGRIAARRIRPVSTRIGSLELRGVPTDFLMGSGSETPVLLGRDALRPFRMTFDPANRLIQIRPE